ncbi:MAG: DUF2207 domain-containing protein [Alphaproteobacteria bacterium]|nr:DUF2207 domain-containing protein [Alphaproteobacteria bacterium]
MHKIFLTICFITFFTNATNCFADIQPITGPVEMVQKSKETQKNVNKRPSGLPNPNNQEEVRKFFKKRFEEVASTPMADNIDWNNAMGIDIIKTQEQYEKEMHDKKPLFQQMYEKAVEALHQSEEVAENTPDAVADENEQNAANTATRFFTLAKKEETVVVQPDIPTVSLSLPSGRKILAPAREHIPYFLSYIDIQANGYIKVEDTITIVANSQKFAHGLRRVFPKYSTSGHRIELILEKVTVNKTKVPYITEEIGRDIVIKPKYNQKLEPGVYTYKFSYFINNKLIRMDNNYLMDWNITGRPLNAFITSANVIVSIPDGHTFKKAGVLVGRGDQYTAFRTNAYSLAGNVIAFSNRTPLFNGENMNVMALLDKNVFIKDFDKSFNLFLADWGAIFYATLGFLTILISFILSLIGLKHDRKKNKFAPSYNGALMRNILIGKYDRMAFVAQLLELYRKNAIDIKNDNNRIFIEKNQTDNTKLTSSEKKALKVIFAKKNVSVEINNINNALFKKAKRILERGINKQIRKYRLIHNIGYILFSCAMLLATEIYIALTSINIAQTMIILLTTTLLYGFYVWIIRHKFKHWYTTVPVKIFALSAIALIWLFSSIYIGGLTSLITLASVVVIFMFTHLFDKHNDFLKDAQETIKNYKEYLTGNADTINLSKDFLNQQANIFALNITEYYPQNVSNKNYYQLDTAESIKQLLIGII